MIKAPYNFVPLGDKVVMPFWAEHVSQDIPFKNAKSGKLRLKITAKNPIFVRNGMPRNADDQDPQRNDFNNINSQYFIPGSSVKGMLRSVVEIMSFGRMKNKVNQDKYSVRDFQNNNIYPKTDLSNKVECGWLYKIGDEYFIDKCGKPGRISHKNLDVLCKEEKISLYYKKAENIRTDNDKSAKSKNEKFPFDRVQKFTLDYDSAGRSVYKVDETGETGIIVMTGQSSVRKESENDKSGGKHLEFIFWNKTPTKTLVKDEAIKNFFFAYYDHDKNQQKEDWKWRKPQLERGEKIPIFYRTEKINGKEEFQDIGLTLLYKITYKYSILDVINQQQKEADHFDLAEVIFGYVDGQRALKGRVHVGHAFLSNDKKPIQETKLEVLAGPKASYYPNYIEQYPNESGKVKSYKTFMDQDSKIRGWKRYPIHSGKVKRNAPPEIRGRVNERVASKFIPMPEGSEFELDIAYHNLRKEELGALISAISFHNTDGLYHSIGSAKPLGYGKIKVAIEAGLSEQEQLDALKAYETFMDNALENPSPSWSKSEQLKELFAMAKPSNEGSNLEYMKLTEFAKAKGRGKNDPQYALQKYSQLNSHEIEIKSMISIGDLEEAKSEYDSEVNSFENLKDIQELKNQKINEAKALLKQRIDEIKVQLKAEVDELKTEAFQREIEKNMEEEEKKRREKRAERQKKAKQSGFILSDDFNTKDRNALNNLNREILAYAKALFNLNENQLKKEKKDQPWVKESDFEIIMETVKDIYENLSNKNEVKKWNQQPLTKNFVYRKVKEWLGEEPAKKLFNELMKS